MVKIITTGDEAIVKVIDKDVRNKFRWSWLDKTVTLTVKIGKNTDEVVEKLSDYIAKCDLPGKAICLYCNDVLNYGSRGCVALIEHATKGKKHQEKVAIRRTNYSLGSAFKTPAVQEPTLNEPLLGKPTSESQPLTPLGDRKAHSEALLLGVIAEHSLPLSMAPVIMDAARELAKDPRALNHLSLDRTTSSYKMRFGLGKTFQDEIVAALRTTPFSLNIDESTSNSDKRVLAVLASYYSLDKRSTNVQHLASLEVIRVDSDRLSSSFNRLFKRLSIPWSNVVSVLMDSCNVMRGTKSGLETRIRMQKAPQLLDVDGDSCHHMHNACKQFCKPFNNWAEYLQSDLHNDVKWSPDLRQYLEEICTILGIKFTMPKRFLTHRWLSCYDVCISNMSMMDAFKVFYLSFIQREDKALYKETAEQILTDRNVSLCGRNRIKDIWKILERKKLTDDGKKRKQRIAQKIIVNTRKTLLTMNLFISVLPLLKEYVCLFQSREPLIHLLHDKQEQVFKDILSCFLKAEYLLGKSAKEMKAINLDCVDKRFLPARRMFIGRGASDIVSSCHKDDITVREFLENVSTAYRLCAVHMQKRLPLNNSLLRAISAIDPRAKGHTETAKALTKLGDYLKPFLSEDQLSRLPLEVHRYQVDNALIVTGEMKVADWWGGIIAGGRYPALARIAMVSLSCFHGPMVESSFNTMGDIIDIRSTRMNIATFSSMQTVRYGLMSQNMSALEYFRKGDVRHDKVDGSLCRNFRTAASAYKREKEENRLKKDEQMRKLRICQEVVKSRAQQNRDQESAAKVARLAHMKAEKRKAKHRLIDLVTKRQKKTH